MARLEMNTKKQMELISMGAVEIIPEEEMVAKLERSIASRKPLTVKLGVDPTRPDLHLGHSVPLNKLRHFQKLGHQVVLLIGDFTALVGDPSEQDTTRPVLTREEVETNARTYVEQASKILDTKRMRLVRNSEWLAPLDFKEVLSLASKFTVARIMERDDFSKRLQEGRPVGLHEFLYPLMQAYDSVVLESDVEIGGTDQKFNLLAGRNLQRVMGQEPQCVLTLPLLEGTDGVQKMSKSLENDVGLTDSPDEMFGKIMSISDEMMWKYYKLLSKKAPQDVERLRQSVEEGSTNPRDAKERLALEIVETYHGKGEAKKAAGEFRRVFSLKELPDQMPVVKFSESDFKKGKIWVVDLVMLLGFASTKGEARRLITGGGVSIDGEKIEDAELEMERERLDGGILRKGRKTFVRVEISGGR